MRIIVIGVGGPRTEELLNNIRSEKTFYDVIKEDVIKKIESQNKEIEKQLVAPHHIMEFLWPKNKKEPIFVSEDGVQFFEGDEGKEVFYVNKNFPSTAHKSILYEGLVDGYWRQCLVFAKEEAANAFIEDYRIRTKPVFTFDEMYALYAGVGDFKNRVKKTSDIYEIAKERCK